MVRRLFLCSCTEHRSWASSGASFVAYSRLSVALPPNRRHRSLCILVRGSPRPRILNRFSSQGAIRLRTSTLLPSSNGAPRSNPPNLLTRSSISTRNVLAHTNPTMVTVTVKVKDLPKGYLPYYLRNRLRRPRISGRRHGLSLSRRLCIRLPRLHRMVNMCVPTFSYPLYP